MFEDLNDRMSTLKITTTYIVLFLFIISKVCGSADEGKKNIGAVSVTCW